MDLNNLIPDNNSSWSVRGDFLMFKKIEHIPICYINDDIVYVSLDARLQKQVVKLTKHLIELNIEFYFTTPEFSNPKGLENFHEKVIEHYLSSYSNAFFYDFKKMDFDLIDNLAKWTDKENCFHLVKDIYKKVLKKVERKGYDHFKNENYFTYSQDIREEFRSLYRHMLISKIV